MQPNDLRRKNLHVLLEGKGAKSALARLISLSPASVTSMLNGTKPLDKEFCNSICHALKLPENWFEAERQSGDVPAAVQKKLAPLPRGSATPAPVMNKSGTAAPASAAAAPAAPATDAQPAAAVAAPAGEAAPSSAPMPQTWPASGGSKVSKVMRLGIGSAGAPAAAPAAAPTSAAAAAPAAQAQAEAPAAADTQAQAPSAATTTRRAAPATPTRALPAAQVGDAMSPPVSGFLVEGGLSPITEALIKTLDQKARQGVLSEDRAFEMLGSVRAL